MYVFTDLGNICTNPSLDSFHLKKYILSFTNLFFWSYYLFNKQD